MMDKGRSIVYLGLYKVARFFNGESVSLGGKSYILIMAHTGSLFFGKVENQCWDL